MVTFEDHLRYGGPDAREILVSLRSNILALGKNIEERVTPAQRITYRVAREFVELKVQKKRVLARVFDMSLPDPSGIVKDISATFKWPHQKEVQITRPDQVAYAMQFIGASYRSHLTTLPG